MKSENTRQLIRMGYYKAPAVEAVRPYLLPRDTEVIELVTDGVIYFPVEGREITVGCGALFWHVAGEETIHRTDPKNPYRCMAIALRAKSTGQRPAPRFSLIEDHQRARELCNELLAAYHNETIDREILSRYVHARMLWEVHLANRQPALLRPANVDAALRLIKREYGNAEIGVPHLAKAAELSEPHLHALFRKHLKQTPFQALTARRIREAKRLLSGSSLAIKAIAGDCGFANIETFYRAFKKMVGTTPQRFRRSHAGPVLANP